MPASAKHPGSSFLVPTARSSAAMLAPPPDDNAGSSFYSTVPIDIGPASASGYVVGRLDRYGLPVPMRMVGPNNEWLEVGERISSGPSKSPTWAMRWMTVPYREWVPAASSERMERGLKPGAGNDFGLRASFAGAPPREKAPEPSPVPYRPAISFRRISAEPALPRVH